MLFAIRDQRTAAILYSISGNSALPFRIVGGHLLDARNPAFFSIFLWR
jgi:hypothetical protein